MERNLRIAPDEPFPEELDELPTPFPQVLDSQIQWQLDRAIITDGEVAPETEFRHQERARNSTSAKPSTSWISCLCLQWQSACRNGRLVSSCNKLSMDLLGNSVHAGGVGMEVARVEQGLESADPRLG